MDTNHEPTELVSVVCSYSGSGGFQAEHNTSLSSALVQTAVSSGLVGGLCGPGSSGLVGGLCGPGSSGLVGGLSGMSPPPLWHQCDMVKLNVDDLQRVLY